RLVNQADRIRVLQTVIPGYVCPSDSNNGIVEAGKDFRNGLGSKSGMPANFQPGISNYVGSRGTRNNDNATNDPQGVFHYKRVRFADIIHGTTNTFLVGERDNPMCKAGSWVGVSNPVGHGQRGFYTVTGNARVPLNVSDPPF